MAIERTAVYATARQPGLSRVVTAFALLLLLALATFFVSSAHAGWAGPAASQRQFSSVEIVDADVIGVEMVGVHQRQIDPAGSLPCPGAADACCGMACGAFAHMAVAPGAPVPSASAGLVSLQSQAPHTAWRSAAFRPPIF
jgi:hypothetical protein